MKILILLFVCFSFTSSSYPTKINWKIDQEVHFNLTSQVDGRGHGLSGTATTYGSTGVMASLLAAKCTKQYSSSSWLVVMNMFNTEVGVGQGGGTGGTVKILETLPLSGKNDEGLGYDVYFEHKFDGTIPTIWVNSADDPTLIQIKISAISAFQTYVLPPKESKKVTFSDPAGKYTALVTSTGSSSDSDDSLLLSKGYDAGDFSYFTDPDVKPSDVSYNGDTLTTVRSDGSIYDSTVNQLIVVTNGASYPNPANQNEDPKSVFDSFLGSKGVLQVKFMGYGGGESKEFMKNAKPSVGASYGNSTLEDKASWVIKKRKTGQMDTNLSHMNENDENELLDVSLKMFLDRPDRMRPALELIRLVRSKTDLLVRMVELFGTLGEKDGRKKSLILFLLARIGSAEAQDILARFMVEGDDPQTQSHAILAAHSLPESETPTRSLLEALWKLASLDDGLDDVGRLARLALDRILAQERAKFPKMENGGCPPTLPYCKQASVNWTIGGHTVGNTLFGELLAGTNFDCNHTWFNFELLAELEGTAILFGLKKDWLVAKAEYGQIDGSPLANELLLEIFDYVVYQKPIPYIACKSQSYDLFHREGGPHLSYVLWVSIIPIVFTLNVDAVVDLEWDWRICLTDLSAMAEIVPKAGLTVYGDVNIDLLILRAGVQMDFNLGPYEVIPKGIVDLSECEIEFTIDLDIPDPFSTDAFAYYQFKKCAFLIFFCHWDQEHQHYFFQYHTSPIEKNLYTKIWKIPLP